MCLNCINYNNIQADGLMDADPNNKLAIFYVRLKKQYEQYKPITYELDLVSNQPKPRAAKLNIIITKLITIFKWGMRESFDNEDDRRDNYWSELNKSFHEDFEMGFVNEGYWDKPKNKLRKYFAILIHTKRIFTVMERIVKHMGHMYQNEDEKIKNFNEEIKCLEFMADGQYKIMGELITSYEEYADKRREEEKIKQLERQEEERKKKEEEKKRKQKEQEERKLRQAKEQQAREEQQKKRQVQLKMKQLAKLKADENSRLITSDYFPANYQTAFNTPSPISHETPHKKLELPNSPEHMGKMKNSDRLFEERFKDELQYFTYALKPQVNAEDKKVCFACKRNLKEGIYSLGGNQNFCHYSGKWYCNDDIAQQRKAIPWRAVESFDLSGYTVCKQAWAELNARYEKPIVEIKKDNPIIKQNKTLYQFLVVKRQMHLIYDSICNLDLIEPLMKKCENYCLKINLFSMKNLYDIYHGRETTRLQRDYEILSKHFYRCDICQKRKGYICPVCKDPVKIFPFELKENVGCSFCRKLYHRKCLPSGQCKCRQED